MKELLSFFRVTTMIQLVLKIRDELAMMMMMVMMSASVQGIPLCVLTGQTILSAGRRRRYEQAGLWLAATGFLLVTSLKMETGCLRAGLHRLSFHIENKIQDQRCLLAPNWRFVHFVDVQIECNYICIVSFETLSVNAAQNKNFVIFCTFFFCFSPDK